MDFVVAKVLRSCPKFVRLGRQKKKRKCVESRRVSQTPF